MFVMIALVSKDEMCSEVRKVLLAPRFLDVGEEKAANEIIRIGVNGNTEDDYVSELLSEAKARSGSAAIHTAWIHRRIDFTVSGGHAARKPYMMTTRFFLGPVMREHETRHYLVLDWAGKFWLDSYVPDIARCFYSRDGSLRVGCRDVERVAHFIQRHVATDPSRLQLFDDHEYPARGAAELVQRFRHSFHEADKLVRRICDICRESGLHPAIREEVALRVAFPHVPLAVFLDRWAHCGGPLCPTTYNSCV